MSDTLETVIRIETRQEILITDVADIKNKMSELPCDVNCLKIKTLQKIVYGAVAVILLAFMITIIDPMDTSIGTADKTSAAVYKVKK